MQRYTKYLFFIGVVLSLYSLIVIQKGGREFYPFYSWKLFSIPSGSDEYESEYRLYGVKGEDTIRINNDEDALFGKNEKFKIISFYARNISDRESQKELKNFGKLIAPDFKTFLLIEEKYKPKDLCDRNYHHIEKKIIKVLK